ncbi:TadE family type IV pilus minor pilin [Prauserella halophila]|uniref:TadE family type IV pilus minor pilin n=1 Tax=Prauserella halophila TaxID=185641 RepID=UPI0020A5E116|nr:TadE family type IV pilus minor pilin [Prauserella halophila]
MTVEGAITVCSLIVVLGLVLSVVTAMLAQVRCADAAGEAARLLGRGDDARAREAVRRLAPDGATFAAADDGTGVEVTVRSPFLGGLLPGVELSAGAYAVREPGAEGDRPDGGEHDGGAHEGENPDGEDSDTEDSDTEDSDTEDSDTEDSDGEGSAGEVPEGGGGSGTDHDGGRPGGGGAVAGGDRTGEAEERR